MSNNPGFQDVPARVDIDQLELQILAYWDKKNIFKRSLDQHKDSEVFTFYDGPPYATGKPHYGHILQSALKDTVLRYKNMQGYHVPRRVGWDCHGLPVETMVEQELGFKTKQDIEKFGLAKFNAHCRSSVLRHIDEFASTLKRIGRWADYENAYTTLDQDYMESEWWVFKQMWEQGLIYQAYRSTPYCIRCATPLSNFEVTSNYSDKTDTAIYVLLPINDLENTFLLIWTTTPWTLPGNAAVAYNPKLKYVKVEHDEKFIILAKDRLNDAIESEYKIIQEYTGKELDRLNIHYQPLYQVPLGDKDEAANVYQLIPSDHVNNNEGTGLVHIAPAFGEEDAELGLQHKLPTLRTVDTNGNFTDDVPQYAAQNIFKTNLKIISDLKSRGQLLRQEQYTHSYPFCWRCDQPLIYYALDSWFIRIKKIKKQLLVNNEQINWIPKHVKHGRFGKGIETAPDWAISRNRFWSVPLPIWVCNKCDQQVCVGSIMELKELTNKKEIKDIHRPFVDELVWSCSNCTGTMQRVEEVLDVWFDSASMPYSQWHYPFENKELVENGYPADFIVESIEMTRAWFYVLHVVAAALTAKDIGLGKNQPAFKNAIASGLIFAADGQKLSKKLKNYPELELTIAKYGADVLRFYLLTSASLGEPYKFSEKDLLQIQRNTYQTLWNVYSFFIRYANIHNWSPPKKSPTPSSHLLDRWILKRLQSLQLEVTKYTDSFQIDSAARVFISFVDDLSNWYLRRSRERFQVASSISDTDTNNAFNTLYQVLTNTTKLLAPFMPFLTEEIYLNLTTGASVHLEDFPKTEKLSQDDILLLDNMRAARAVVTEGLSVRAREGIKVRQPLSQLIVVADSISSELAAIIKDEVNIKELKFTKQLPDGSHFAISAPDNRIQVALNTELNDDLKAEGIARDVIRQGQLLRRSAGYALDDKITLILATDDQKLIDILTQQEPLITKALQADKVINEVNREDASEDITVNDVKLHIGVMK